ncbi:MAG: YfhO family protein [Flavobacteriales bacterium]|nr:YfhO family protein [Flavobacteriales bacterium]
MEKIKHFFKSNWEHFAAFGIFLLVALAYFSPVLEGLSLKLHDMQGFNGMANEAMTYHSWFGSKSAWTNSMFGGMPTYIIYYPNFNPFYELHVFFSGLFGYPVVAVIYSTMSFYLLARVLKTNFWIAILGALAYAFVSYNIIIIQVGHMTKMMAISLFPGVLAGLIMLLRSKWEKRWLGFVVFTFFMAMEIMVYHIQMTYYLGFVLAFMILFEFIRYYKSKEIGQFAKRMAFIVVAVILAGVANFSNNFETYKYSKHSMRGAPVLESEAKPDEATLSEYDKMNMSKGLKRDYITHWSYGIGETYNLFVPNSKGANHLTTEYFETLGKENRQIQQLAYQEYQKNRGRTFGGYWGDQPGTVGPNYIGAIIVFFALLYLILVNNWLKWSLLGATILTIMLSWGKNLGGDIGSMWLTNLFIDYVPLYAKFRTVSSMLVIANFTFPIMAILFLREITNKTWAEENLKKITITGGSVIGAILLIGLVPSVFFDFLNQAELLAIDQLEKSNPNGANTLYEATISIREGMFWDSTLSRLMYIVPAFIIVLLFIKKTIPAKFAFPLLVILTLADVWQEDQHFLNNEKSKGKYTYWQKQKKHANKQYATQGDYAILQNEMRQKPSIQQEIAKRTAEWKKENGKRMSKFDKENIEFQTLNFETNYRVMDLDNPFNSSRASYFHKSTGGYSPAKLRRYQDIIDGYISKELAHLNSRDFGKTKVLNMLNNKYYLYQGKLFAVNDQTYGNAWFVNQIKEVSSANEEHAEIANIDPKNTVILHQDELKKLQNKTSSANGSVKLVSYKPDVLTYESNNPTTGIAVFSEIYYPEGWTAFIDGEEVSILRANYILRALEIPAGKHKIEFRMVNNRSMIGGILSLLVFLMTIGALYLNYKRKG